MELINITKLVSYHYTLLYSDPLLSQSSVLLNCKTVILQQDFPVLALPLTQLHSVVGNPSPAIHLLLPCLFYLSCYKLRMQEYRSSIKPTATDQSCTWSFLSFQSHKNSPYNLQPTSQICSETSSWTLTSSHRARVLLDPIAPSTVLYYRIHRYSASYLVTFLSPR